jgi:hypothetical protein
MMAEWKVSWMDEGWVSMKAAAMAVSWAEKLEE